MDKLKMHSPDLTARNIDRIAELFPTVITESLDDDGNPVRAIDFDLLRQELSDHVVEGPQERYQLDWPGKREALFAANAPIAKSLRPIQEQSVEFNTTQNLFIEGENLEALKLLQESYLGRIKLIYIDPPYNTGTDFVYRDDFSESNSVYLRRSGQSNDDGTMLIAKSESSGRFHSNWLTMMYARLKVARNFLADDGLLFISIDHHELHTLRALLGEIFGQENFVGLITRATGTPTGGGFSGLTNMADYLLVFKRSNLATLHGLEFGESDAAPYNEKDARGSYLVRPLRRTGGEDRKDDRPSMYYGIEAPDGSIVFPIGPGGYESRWRCGRDRYEAMCHEGLIEWKQIERGDGPVWHPYQKFYLDGREKRPSTLWQALDGNKKGTRELRAHFDSERVFESPKPVALIERIIQIATDSDSVVLDFFAGSATTAEAVFRANARDGGSRRFILIQMAEATPPGSAAAKAGFSTISELARERVRRAGTKFASNTPGGTQDVGFRALEVASTNLLDVHRTPDALSQDQLGLYADSLKVGRTSQDLVFQVLLDWGLELTLPIAVERIDGHEVFDVDEGALIACFDAAISITVVEAIAKRTPLRAVFRDAGFPTDADRINAEQIFREVSPATDVRAI